MSVYHVLKYAILYENVMFCLLQVLIYCTFTGVCKLSIVTDIMFSLLCFKLHVHVLQHFIHVQSYT